MTRRPATCSPDVAARWRPAPPHVADRRRRPGGPGRRLGAGGRGLRITLLESRPRLGGRASSFNDPATGELVDNCQHVSMACCTNLADFCRRVGTADLFRREPERRLPRERGRALPAPGRPAAGPAAPGRQLPRGPDTSTGRQAARGLRPGLPPVRRRGDRPGESFADWLLRHGQTMRTIDRFWGTVLVSALNERLDQMDVGHARKVFLDGFLRNRTGFQMELPTVPLGELYGPRLETWLDGAGVEVRLTTGVRSIECEDGGRSRGDAPLRRADRRRLRRPGRPVRPRPARCCRSMPRRRSRPSRRWTDGIVADHRDPPLVRPPGLPARLTRRATVGRLDPVGLQPHGDPGPPSRTAGGQYLQLVISAAYDLLPLDKAAIRDAVLADLAEIWPAAREAELLRWWVVTEHGATFAVRPGIDALRPPQRTPIDGLFLAGDWTATGWPATMEGAVRSGYLAAEGILDDLGIPDPAGPSRVAGLAAGPPAARGRLGDPGRPRGQALCNGPRRPSVEPSRSTAPVRAPPANRLTDDGTCRSP